MIDRQNPYLNFCRDRLLPIWERWTDGQPSLRRALDGASADPHAQAEQRAAVLHVIADLMVEGSTWAESAAMCAAFAALAALEGQIDGGFREFVRLALEADREAGKQAWRA